MREPGFTTFLLLGVISTSLAIVGPANADLSTWSKLPTETPGPTVGGTMPVVWDPNASRMLCIPNADPDLYSLTPGEGTAWSVTAISGSMGERKYARAVFDAARNRVLVFGGYRFVNQDWVLHGETWELKLDPSPTWRLLSPTGQGPAPRYGATLAFDPVSERMFVFGGQNGHIYNDLFALSVASGDGTWNTLVADAQPGSPSGRVNASATVDPVRRRLLLFGGGGLGGFVNDLWEVPIDTPPVWASIPTNATPAARGSHYAIYDSANDRMVIHAGVDGFGPVITAAALPLSGPPTWISLPSQPVGSDRFGAVYDAANERMLVPHQDKTHALSLAGTPQWSLFEHHILPGVNSAGAIASDSRTLIVVGGTPNYDDGSVVTWTLDLTNPAATWIRLGATGGPVNRSRMTCVWDPVRSRFLVYGGVGLGSERYNDLWSLTLSPPQWTQLSPTGAIPSLANSTYSWQGFYDPSGDRLVFLSFEAIEPCCSPPTYINDIYLLPLSGPTALQWSQHSIFPVGFRRRLGASFSYDVTRHVGWIYGGRDNLRAAIDDVWKVSLNGFPSASPWPVNGAPAPGRAFHAAGFDPVRARLVVAGGANITGFTEVPLGDTWALDVGVGNQWQQLATGGPSLPPRGHAAAAFDALGDRLVLFGGRSGEFLPRDDTWSLSFLPALDVDPGISRLELTLRAAHPIVGDLIVDFSLPTAGSGTLDLFDVSGRLVRRATTTGLPAGPHTLKLVARTQIVPGIYFVRLRHADGERSLRVVTL